ncbi:MAG: vWA domain-containing protein [Polyangia bacterium]
MRHTASLILGTLLALVGATRVARAARCPVVMVVLDRSGSMDSDPTGGFGTPSKLDLAKTALSKLMMQYGDQIPFGFADFTSTGATCSDGVEIVVKPADGTKAMITAAIAAVQTDGGTNTGPAIDAVAALPEMNDSTRPGSYILLVTDGEPNCPGTIGTETDDPAYTVGAIKRAADKGIKTFVVGFGALPQPDKDAMNMMAAAGGEPCTGTTCSGQQYYSAEDDASLNAAISSISNVILGEFGGACDDSCYSNGCTNAGEICVKGQCVADPCIGVQATCAPTDYCYTNGTTAGTCTPQCPSACPTGQACTLNGCQPDPCAAMSCGSGAVCAAGNCITTTCSPACAANLACVNGKCQDDPCRYITCPAGAQCTANVGTCVSSGSGTGDGGTGGKHRGSSSGCDYAPQGASTGLAFVALGFLLLALRRRRA